jgi:ABC-type sugar transport system substrate-binding protein
MAIMTRLMTIVLAVVGLALGTAATASADETGFVNAVDSLDYYAISCPGCAQDAIDVGYRACAGFDRGGDAAAIQAVLDSYNGPGQTHAEYYATLFAQYAANHLCTEHEGEIGPI